VIRRTVGEGVFSNLSTNLPYSLKLKTISILKNLKLAGTGRILKEVLSDDNDEVRLLAFSILSNEENKLTKNIYFLQEKLKEVKENEEKAEILQNIGILYWEMIFLDIVDEELKDFYLQEAKRYFTEYLKIKESFDSLFYLGRIALREEEFDAAEKYFSKALNIKKDNKILPYTAEIYFYRKNYKKVLQILQNLDIYSIHPNFYPNYKVWAKYE
jgi:tetratricopeptide (TPR) repeat protein